MSATLQTIRKELNRLASEIRGFDLAKALPVERREMIEKQYKALRETLRDLQKRVDTSFEKFVSLVRKNRASVKKTARKAGSSAKKKSAGKKAPKKAASAKKTARRSN